MTEDESITAPGGWCIPADTVYDAAALNLNEYTAPVMFPLVTVNRGVRFDFTDRRTDAEKAAADAMAALVHRYVGDIITAQHEVLDAACLEALRDGWDVHVHRRDYQPRDAHPGSVRFFGIELAPRRTPALSIPTIYEHQTDWRWETDDDD